MFYTFYQFYLYSTMPLSSPLNRDTALELPKISVLTTKKADKDPKIELNKIVQLINNRGPIRGEQRVGESETSTETATRGGGREGGVIC
jgi:hypothetical protein